jgi:peptidoglycan L-alanyl-D-glutamate endopeptidase CwlK
MASRKIEDCSDRIRHVIVSFEERLEREGLKFKRSCTKRSQEEQNALWKRGRYPLDVVNAAYKSVGLPPISEKENRSPVTWVTLTVHSSGDAVDYYQDVDGRACYDVKTDTDGDSIPDWEEFGRIARECGLVWGGDWKKKDLPHVQFKEV